jgi:hypothetical protein
VSPHFLAAAALAMAIAVMACGIGAGWSARNAAKRVAGTLAAMTGAALALAALGASEAHVLAGIVVALVQTAIGAALVVRLHEHYGGGEAPDIDAADAQREPAEPDA